MQKIVKTTEQVLGVTWNSDIYETREFAGEAWGNRHTRHIGERLDKLIHEAVLKALDLNNKLGFVDYFITNAKITIEWKPKNVKVY